MELTDLKYIKDEKELINQILRHTDNFNLTKYFNDEYSCMQNNERTNKERAALTRITKKSRYNLVVFTEHLYAEMKLNSVLHREIENPSNEEIDNNEKVYEKAINDAIKNNIEHQNVTIEMYGNKVDVFLPERINAHQKISLREFARELKTASKKTGKKIEVDVMVYFLKDNGDIDQKDVLRIMDYENGHDEFCKHILQIELKEHKCARERVFLKNPYEVERQDKSEEEEK